MFHSRAYKKLTRLHKRSLSVIYSDRNSNAEELLKNNSVPIHSKKIETVAIEINQVANDVSPEIMNEIFQPRKGSHYNLRYTSEFIIPPIHSV